MELADRLCGVPLMAAHVEACTSGRPPEVHRRREKGVVGKAVVFARDGMTVGDTQRWLADPDVRDVPWPGTPVGRGEPICTVIATGSTFVECRAALAARAAVIYAGLC